MRGKEARGEALCSVSFSPGAIRFPVTLRHLTSCYLLPLQAADTMSPEPSCHHVAPDVIMFAPSLQAGYTMSPELMYSPMSSSCRAVLMCIKEMRLNVDLKKMDIQRKMEHMMAWFVKVSCWYRTVRHSVPNRFRLFEKFRYIFLR